MNPWIVVVAAVVVVLLVVAARLGWIDLSTKRGAGGSYGGAFGIGDEVFAPARHEAQLEMDRQTILPAPSPVAGDGDKGIYEGSLTIELDEESPPTRSRE